MSPRNNRVDAAGTRRRIVRAAVDRAALHGLESLTIGELARELDLSKSGTVGPFGSRAALQLEVLRTAQDEFAAAVIAPAQTMPHGTSRLMRTLELWSEYLTSSPFPNGCFFTAAACELDGQPGPLRDSVQETITAWRSLLKQDIEAAMASGDIREDMPTNLALTLLAGAAMAVNQEIQLLSIPYSPSQAMDVLLSAIGCNSSAASRRGKAG